MLVSVKQVPDEPIIIVTYKAPFEPSVDIVAAQKQIADILKYGDDVMFRIDDLSAAEMDWAQFVEGISEATQDVPGSMVDPRIRGILVGEGAMVQMASESMKQEQYGSTNTPMFTALEDALAHARNRAEATSS